MASGSIPLPRPLPGPNRGRAMVAPVAAAAPPCALFARCSLHQPAAQLLPSRPAPLGLAAARGRPQVGLQVGLRRGCPPSQGVRGHARTALQHWLPVAVCGPILRAHCVTCTSSAASSGGCGAGAGARAAGERCGCALGEGGCCGGGREPGRGEPGGRGAPEFPARLSAQGVRRASSLESRTWQCSEASLGPKACRAARASGLSRDAGLSQLRRVLDVIRGRTYEDALMMLEYMPYRACEPILKTLISVRCLRCRASPQAAASLPRKLCFAHQCEAGTVRLCARLSGLCSHVLTLDSNFAAQSPTEIFQQ